MNRKLLVNEQLEWETLGADENEKILQVIENQIKLYPTLKRKKTLPKKKRQKAKELKETFSDDQKPAQITVDDLFKKHIRIGINAVTKELERNPKNVRFVLVCRTCKPILTRHLFIMCSQFDIRAGSVQNLSERLSKIFNLKTVGAFAICRSYHKLEDKDTNPSGIELEPRLVELTNKISQFLPQLRKPFSLKPELKRIINDKNMFSLNLIEPLETTQVKEMVDPKEADEPMNVEIHEVTNEDETFGSDFLSIEKSRASDSYISFDSNKNFIQFQDGFSDHENGTNQISTNTNKRKLSSFFYQQENGLTLNKMGIRYRTTDKNRQKLKRNTKQQKTTVKK